MKRRIPNYITGHNHFGEHVYFSCNGGTPREIHDDQSRTIIVYSGEELQADCIAQHDGQIVWSRSVNLHYRNRYETVDITTDAGHAD